MRWMPAAALIALSAMALPVTAQVHKCKDAYGRTTYADAPCAAGQSGGLLERRRSQSDIYRERMQAVEAEDRKQIQRTAEQEREWETSSQRAIQPLTAPVMRHSSNDWARRKELANAATSASSITRNNGRWDEAAEAQRASERRERAAQQARSNPPTQITNCTDAFCTDEKGGVYHRTLPNFMTGPNGQACHRAGDMWNCH